MNPLTTYPGFFTDEGGGARPKTESGGWVFGEGVATPSPPAGERCELPRRGSGRSPPPSRPHKGFPLFSAQRMISPATIGLILLIVDSHAAIRGGGQDPRAPLAYVPAFHFLQVVVTLRFDIDWTAIRPPFDFQHHYRAAPLRS